VVRGGITAQGADGTSLLLYDAGCWLLLRIRRHSPGPRRRCDPRGRHLRPVPRSGRATDQAADLNGAGEFANNSLGSYCI